MAGQLIAKNIDAAPFYSIHHYYINKAAKAAGEDILALPFVEVGFKIFSAEVESVLASHPGVVESAIVARPCPVLGERVHAFVTVREPVPSTLELKRYVQDKLSDYKVPETFTLSMDPQPRNSNGKILKRLLREALRLEADGNPQQRP